MNLNVPRIDDGAKLTDSELDAGIRTAWPARRTYAGCTGACNQGRLPCRAPDACGLPIAEPTYRRPRTVSFWGVAALLLLILSASFVGAVIYTAVRLVRAFS